VRSLMPSSRSHFILWKVLILCVVGGLLFVLDACSSSKPDPVPVLRSSDSDKTPSWGFYQILWHKNQFLGQLDQERALLGGQPEYILFFRDLNRQRGFPTKIVEALAERNLQAVISLELNPWGNAKQEYLQAIIEGRYDDFFQRWGRDAAASGEEVVLRFGFEMNGNWFSWGQKPEWFRQAWRRAHAQMAIGLDGADNVKWMFCPNVLYGGQTPETGFAPYYPGDDVVDLLGLDGYNFGDHHSQWHVWQSYEEVFGKSIDALAAYGKPLWIAEIGSVDDPRKAAWMEDALSRIRADERVETVLFFHFDKRREGEANWRLDSDEASLEVFHAWLEEGIQVIPETAP